MIKHAIKQSDFLLERRQDNLVIILQFQIGKGVFLKGVIDMGGSL